MSNKINKQIFGIKICGVLRPEEYGADLHRCRIDYEFSEIVYPIKNYVEDLSWLFLGTIFNHVAADGDEFTDFQENYEKIISTGFPEDSHHNRVGIKGFFPKYSKFVLGDWTEIFGFKGDIVPSQYVDTMGNITDQSKIDNDFSVLFRCIDGAFWEVFSPNKELIGILKVKFPFCLSAVLH